MKIRIQDIRKKAMLLSIIFLFTGAVISAVGFAMADFNVHNLKEEGSPKWYRTIHVEDGTLSLGVNLGDIQITGISLP